MLHRSNKRENKLNEIDELIKNREIGKKENKKELSKGGYAFDTNVIDLFNSTQYQDKNIFELNKMIDEKFDIDYVGLLKDFLNNVHDDGTYKFVTNLRNKFNSKAIYDLKILSDEDQVEFLNKNFRNESFAIVRSSSRFVKKPHVFVAKTAV